MRGHDDLPPELLGLRLHGEGLDDADLAAWFADEQDGYFGIAGPAADDEAQQRSAANEYHLFRHLPPRRFACCLALGAAGGREYVGLAGRVERFVAIEPGRGFWRDTIAGAPAEYRVPTLRGTIDLPDGACDLAGAFGVLHHIPNVAEVLAELARVLAPGAPLMLREPITSLGDFRRPRPGLTRNERGIPHAMMDQMLAAAGFRIRRKRFVSVPGTRELPARLGLSNAWDNPAIIRLDAALARLTAWNARYWRPRLWHKLAARAAYWLAERG
ncbi:MAG: methyltransferase domain-containing protein [Novosphingobium sp.]|nr:methyltransferase domain-containing protein [Novosphingobium sp.]